MGYVAWATLTVSLFFFGFAAGSNLKVHKPSTVEGSIMISIILAIIAMILFVLPGRLFLTWI